MAEETGLPCLIAENPLTCVAEVGVGLLTSSMRKADFLTAPKSFDSGLLWQSIPVKESSVMKKLFFLSADPNNHSLLRPMYQDSQDGYTKTLRTYLSVLVYPITYVSNLPRNATKGLGCLSDRSAIIDQNKKLKEENIQLKSEQQVYKLDAENKRLYALLESYPDRKRNFLFADISQRVYFQIDIKLQSIKEVLMVLTLGMLWQIQMGS